MLTVVIPVGPYHEAIAERAIASCLNQTLKVSVIVIYDQDRRGAGWARNQGIAQTQTPFLSFLDADDELEPTFAEKTLRAYNGREYVYTDWHAAEVISAPDCAWLNGSWHIVTALLPTVWVQHVGGFDEHLSGGEDTDFWLKLTRSGLCGTRIPEALVHYHKEGERGHAFVTGAQFHPIMQLFTERYGGKPMACCRDEVIRDEFPLGEAQPGDVLGEILKEGSRQFVGRASGRVYRRFGNSRKLYLDPRDIDASPQMFGRVVEMPGVVQESDFERFARDVRLQMTGIQGQQEIIPVQSSTSVQVPVKADIDTVLRLYPNQ